MITAQTEQIPRALEQELREWLRKPPAETFARILDGMVKEAQVAALKAMHESTDYPLKLDLAKQCFETADRYEHTLALFRTFQARAEGTPFSIVKLT